MPAPKGNTYLFEYYHYDLSKLGIVPDWTDQSMIFRSRITGGSYYVYPSHLIGAVKYVHTRHLKYKQVQESQKILKYNRFNKIKG